MAFPKRILAGRVAQTPTLAQAVHESLRKKWPPTNFFNFREQEIRKSLLGMPFFKTSYSEVLPESRLGYIEASILKIVYTLVEKTVNLCKAVW